METAPQIKSCSENRQKQSCWSRSSNPGPQGPPSSPFALTPSLRALYYQLGREVGRLWAGIHALAKHFWGILKQADGHP